MFRWEITTKNSKCSTILGMELKSSSSHEAQKRNVTAFEEALSKIVSIPRAEMQRRIKTVPEVPVSRHNQYKYVPAKAQSNS